MTILAQAPKLPCLQTHPKAKKAKSMERRQRRRSLPTVPWQRRRGRRLPAVPRWWRACLRRIRHLPLAPDDPGHRERLLYTLEQLCIATDMIISILKDDVAPLTRRPAGANGDQGAAGEVYDV